MPRPPDFFDHQRQLSPTNLPKTERPPPTTHFPTHHHPPFFVGENSYSLPKKSFSISFADFPRLSPSVWLKFCSIFLLFPGLLLLTFRSVLVPLCGEGKAPSNLIKCGDATPVGLPFLFFVLVLQKVCQSSWKNCALKIEFGKNEKNLVQQLAHLICWSYTFLIARQIDERSQSRSVYFFFVFLVNCLWIVVNALDKVYAIKTVKLQMIRVGLKRFSFGGFTKWSLMY